MPPSASFQRSECALHMIEIGFCGDLVISYALRDEKRKLPSTPPLLTPSNNTILGRGRIRLHLHRACGHSTPIHHARPRSPSSTLARARPPHNFIYCRLALSQGCNQATAGHGRQAPHQARRARLHTLAKTLLDALCSLAQRPSPWHLTYRIAPRKLD